MLQRVAGLLKGKVRPESVERGDDSYRVPDNKRVGEVRDEFWGQNALCVERHVLEVDRSLLVFKHPCQDVLGVVLGFRFLVSVAVALALLAVVIGGAKRLVEDLEVTPLDEDPLEGSRDRTRYGPEGEGLPAVSHVISSLAVDQGVEPLVHGFYR